MFDSFEQPVTVLYNFTEVRGEKEYTLQVGVKHENHSPGVRAFCAQLSVTGKDGKDYGGECYRDAHLEWSEFHNELDEGEFDDCEWELYLTFAGDDGKEPTSADDIEAIEAVWAQYETMEKEENFLHSQQ